MANRKIFKKEISALCGLLLEDLIIYHMLSKEPEAEKANVLFEKVQHLALEFRRKASKTAVSQSEVKAKAYFAHLWQDFSDKYNTLFEEIMELSKSEN